MRILLLTLFLVRLAATAAVLRADWPQFLGPSRDGTAAGENIEDNWGGSGPPVIWRYAVGHGLSGPVVSAGRVVISYRRGPEEIIDLLDSSSGKRIWSVGAPSSYRDSFGADDDGPRATPTIANGRVFSLGAEGQVLALDFESGKKIWGLDSRQAFNAPLGYFGFACSPIVEGNSVLLNIGGSNGAGIIALDVSSGKLLWKATDDEASYSSPVVANLGKSRGVLFFTRSGLRALDPATGSVRASFPWRARIAASVNAATPIVAKEQVFITASYGTGAALLNFEEGTLRPAWTSDDAISAHYATPVLRNGFLYGLDGRVDSGSPSLKCIELATGKTRWSRKGFGGGSLLLAGERILILTETGELASVKASPDAFEEIARAKVMAGAVRAHPALVAGRLYARNANELVVLDLSKKP